MNPTPAGNAPLCEIDAGGNPVVVTVKLPAWPTKNVVEFALVMAGAWFTTSVKLWVGELPAVLVAVNVVAYVPPVPAAGVPLSVPVPLPLSVKLTPDGSAAPPRVIDGVGKPVVVTVNEPAWPTVNVVALALVMAGACWVKKLSRPTVLPFCTSMFLARKAPTAFVLLSRISVPFGAYTLARSVPPVPVSTATVVVEGEA